MAAPALRPRSPSEIVDAAFQIMRAHYGALVSCSAIAYVPLLLIKLLVVGNPLRFLGGPLDTIPTDLVWSTGIALLGGWLTFAVMSAVLLVYTSQAYLGDEVDVAAAVRLAFSRLPLVLVAALMRFLLMVLAFIFMAFPILYVVALLFAVTPVIVLERSGVGAAMRRSASLSKGRKWHILNTLGLVAIIYYVLVIGFSVIASLLGDFVVSTIVAATVTVLVYPVVAITETILYYDARIRSEGFDIELMAGALEPSPSSTAT